MIWEADIGDDPLVHKSGALHISPVYKIKIQWYFDLSGNLETVSS